jgi:hypothetical protein
MNGPIPENFELIPLVAVISSFVHHIYMALAVSAAHLSHFLPPLQEQLGVPVTSDHNAPTHLSSNARARRSINVF